MVHVDAAHHQLFLSDTSEMFYELTRSDMVLSGVLSYEDTEVLPAHQTAIRYRYEVRGSTSL